MVLVKVEKLENKVKDIIAWKNIGLRRIVNANLVIEKLK